MLLFIYTFLFRHVEDNFQSLEHTRLELIGKEHHIERLIIFDFFLLKRRLHYIKIIFLFSSKTEPELINLLTKLTNIHTDLNSKQAEHEKYVNVRHKID